MGQAAMHFRENDTQQLIDEFPDAHIWNIDGFSGLTVVFYVTDDDVKANELNGTSERIKQRCYELIKKYDEFAY